MVRNLGSLSTPRSNMSRPASANERARDGAVDMLSNETDGASHPFGVILTMNSQPNLINNDLLNIPDGNQERY